MQIAQTALEHLRRRSKACSLCFAQEIHDVSRHKADSVPGFRRPIAESTLIVLAPGQNTKGMLQLLVHFGTAQSEVGFVREHQAAECATADLFAAAMREILQVRIEPMS